MSNSVDNRVVQMDFDNKRFESNVKTTLSTLDRLKKALHFGEETKSLEELERASERVTLGNIASAVEALESKFSLLGIAGMTAMQKIASSAIDAGVHLVKSLSIDQISAGFDKYGQKMTAVRTIMAATGDDLGTVDKYLARLNDYTDQTSYNFTEMASTIGKFTAAGVDLPIAERAMEGIANWAARSGVNAQGASPAFYNLAQAIGAGTLKLQDWKSIENANMATKEFKQTLMDEAVAAGTLIKELDSAKKAHYYYVKETGSGKKKKTKKEEVTVEGMSASLSSGWASRDVLLATLNRYYQDELEIDSEEVDKVTKAIEEKTKAINAEKDATKKKKLEEEKDLLVQKKQRMEAYMSAREAKSFGEAVDAVKDAVSTGWMNTFELIFGNVEEAAKFFTALCDTIIEDIVDPITTARNRLLEGWNFLGGRDSLVQGLKNLWEIVKLVADPIGQAFEKIFGGKGYFTEENTWFKDITQPGVKYLESASGDIPLYVKISEWSRILKDATDNIVNFTQKVIDWFSATDDEGVTHTDRLVNIFTGVFSVVDLILQGLSAVWGFVKEIFHQLMPTFDKVLALFSDIGEHITEFVENLKKNKTLTKIMQKLAAAFVPITSRLPGLVQRVRDLINEVRNFIATNPAVQKFLGTMRTMFSTILDKLPAVVEGIIQFGKSIVNTIKNSSEWKAIVSAYNKYIKPLGRWFLELGTEIGQAITDFFNIDTSGENGLWNKLKKRFSVFDRLGPWFSEKWEKLKKEFPILQKLEDWWNTSEIAKKIQEIAGVLSGAFNAFMDADTSDEESIFGKIKKRISAAFDVIGDWLTDEWEKVKAKYPILQSIQDFFSNLFPKGTVDSDAEGEAEKGTTVADSIKNLLSRLKEILSTINIGDLLKVGALVFAGIKIVSAFKKLKQTFGFLTTAKEFVESGKNVLDRISGKVTGVDKVRKLATKLLPLAAGIWLLADSLKKVGEMEWEDVGKGLLALGGLFAESGAFTVLVNNLTKSGSSGVLKMGSLIGTGISIWILATTLKKLEGMTMDQIGTGLLAIGGLFAEEGAFMILVSRLSKCTIGSALSFTKLIGVAVSIWLLGKTLQQLAGLELDNVGTGLLAMGGIFAEEGAFMILVSRLTKFNFGSALSFTKLIGVALSIWLLGRTLEKLGNLELSTVGSGLLAMGGLFAEEGAFMILVSRLTKFNFGSALGFGKLIGVALSIYLLGKALQELGNMDFDHVGTGLLAMGGLFAEEGAFMILVSRLTKFNFGSALGFGKLIGVALSIWLLGQTLQKLSNMELGNVGTGLLAMAGIMTELGIFMALISRIHFNVSAIFGVIVSAAAIGALMLAFGEAAKTAKDLTPEQMLAFGATIGLLAIALSGISVVVTVLGGLGVGAALKGAVGLVAIMGALAVGVSLFATITGDAIASFAACMAEVGASISLFDSVTAGVQSEHVKQMLDLGVLMGEKMAVIAGYSYANLDSFVASFGRLGGSIRLFSLMTTGLEIGSYSTLISDIVKMATDLSGISAVPDVSETIGNIGGAIKLYGQSLEGVDLSTAPDTESLKKVFDTILQAVPDTESLTSFTEFAGDDKKSELTNFAIGLTNISTAFSEFANSLKEANFDNISQAVTALSTIAGLNEHLTTAKESVLMLGPFAVAITETKASLSTFAADIVVLGTALKDFGTGLEGVDTGKIDSGVTILGKIAAINGALPKTGGISSWLTGSISLSRFASQLTLLGEGASAFNNSITDSNFDEGKITGAVTAISAIADINSKLTKTGGIASWFSGDIDLKKFGEDLGALGEGMKNFVTSFGDTDVGSNITDALKPLEKIADIQAKLDDTYTSISWFASDLVAMAGYMVSFNETLSGITWADTTVIESIMNWATDYSSRLKGLDKGKYRLADLGWDIDQFYNYIRNVNNKYNANDFSNLDAIIEHFNGLFESIGPGLGTTLVDSIIAGLTGKEEIIGQSGASFVGYLTSGMDGKKSDVRLVGGSLAVEGANGANAFSWAFTVAGYNLTIGLANGIASAAAVQAVVNNVTAVCSRIVSAAKKALDEKSPSRLFKQIGAYTIEGMAIGIQEKASSSEQTMTKVAERVISAAEDGLSSGMKSLISDNPFDPEKWVSVNDWYSYISQMADAKGYQIDMPITPVLDATSLANARNQIQSGLQTQALNVSQSAENAFELAATDYGSNFKEIVEQVHGLSDQLDEMNTALANMQIVLDTGVLVGQTTAAYDRSLGRRVAYNSRGMRP